MKFTANEILGRNVPQKLCVFTAVKEYLTPYFSPIPICTFEW